MTAYIHIIIYNPKWSRITKSTILKQTCSKYITRKTCTESPCRDENPTSFCSPFRCQVLACLRRGDGRDYQGHGQVGNTKMNAGSGGYFLPRHRRSGRAAGFPWKNDLHHGVCVFSLLFFRWVFDRNFKHHWEKPSNIYVDTYIE